MCMRLSEKVSFEEVLVNFRLHHSVKMQYEQNTNSDTEISLQQANEQFGEWYKVLLNREDILQVVLPWHLSCSGKIELVPKSGLTVKQTVEKLLHIEDAVANENPICYGKMLKLSKAPFSPLFLSTQAIERDDYSSLHTKNGLTHIDGLHRMIAWERFGRLTKGVWVEAYIAGHIN